MRRNAKSALKQGKIKEKDIDRALLNLFEVQLRLGLYDGDPSAGKYGSLGPEDVCLKEHKDLALEAAREGVVLLKNDKNFLPLNKNDITSVALIGYGANSTDQLGGTYSGIPCEPISYLEGVQKYVKDTNYAVGCLNISCTSSSQFDEAITIAKKADYVIVVAGLDLTQETEDLDRVTLLLPDPKIVSILWVGYPGEAGGKALAEIIFGDYNPGGRLPMTWYPESFTKVPMSDMNMRADPARGYPGRTYRFYTGECVFKFGHGLSYSTFNSNFLSAPATLKLSRLQNSGSINGKVYETKDRIKYILTKENQSCDSLRFHVEVSVTNTGNMGGGHVVLLFQKAASVIKGAPLKQLVGFTRVQTSPRETVTTSLLVDPCKHFSFANEHGNRILPLGNHVLMLDDLEHHLLIQA